MSALPKPASTRVITGKVRFSYAHVWEPHAITEGAEPKYSVCLLIPKTDRQTIADIKAAIEAATAFRWPTKRPPNLANSLRDGDAEDKGEAYVGHYFINVSSTKKPGIVDANVKPILDQTEFYSGCYGRAEINAFAYERAGNRGVSFGLNNLQKISDGEPLGGRSRPEDVFRPASNDEGPGF